MDTAHDALFSEYARLPEDLQVRTAITSNGPSTCEKLGSLLLGGGQPSGEVRRFRARMGFDALLAAWADAPLDLALSRRLWDLHRALKSDLAPLPEGAALLLMQVMKLWRSPSQAELDRFNALVDSRRWEAVARLVKEQARGGEATLFWLNAAWSLAKLTCEYSLIGLHEGLLPAGLEPLARKLRADAAYFTDDMDLAVREYEAAVQLCPLPSWELALAGALLAGGHRNPALRAMLQALRKSPWRTSDVLRAHDVAFGLDLRERVPEGAVAILLYTCNKPRELDRTLAGLFASAIDGAQVTVLDNGSGEDAGRVLREWKERFGPQRFAVESLPVNIGAPAARNWLLSLPVARAADWIAFLDDDVLLPANWLAKLGAAAEAYPDAGAWGCKIRDSRAARLLQCVDLFIDPDSLLPEGPASPEGMDLDFSFSESLDAGQFDYIRPCLSVMGCCHLFRAETLRAGGGFDIAFSPSQFDDVDHDLRLALAKRPPVYTGHLAVSHLRPLPHFSPPPTVAQRMGEMNKGKLRLKHAGDMPKLLDVQRRMLLDDTREKRLRLSAFCAEAGL